MYDVNTLDKLLLGVYDIIKSDIRDIVYEEAKRAIRDFENEKKMGKTYTRQEVCEILNISTNTLWKITKNGQIKSSNVGRRVVYTQQAVDDYIHGIEGGKWKYDSFSRHNLQKKTYLMTDKNTGLTKIGYSIDPSKRERTLQSEKPTIVCLFVLDRNIEKELHNNYATKRIRGEWFKLTNDEISNIVDEYGFESINEAMD